MDINKYIKELLFQHECVIIPDFGGFVTNYFAAEINMSINTIIPPSKAISFNANLVQNDGLLVNFIARNEDLSFAEAKGKLDAYTNDLKNSLNSGERIKLNGIGSFLIDENEKLQFEPDLSHNYLVDSFGLSPINVKEIRNPAIEEAYKNIERKKAEAKKSKNLIILLKEIFKRKKIKKIALGIPVLLAIIFIPFNPKINKIFKLESAGFNPVNQFSESPENDYNVENRLSESVNNNYSFPIFENTANILDNFDIPEIITNNDKIYFIIAGSFINSENAIMYQQNLTEQGYSAEILPSTDKYYRVSIFNSVEKIYALEKLNDIYSVSQSLKLWMFEK